MGMNIRNELRIFVICLNSLAGENKEKGGEYKIVGSGQWAKKTFVEHFDLRVQNSLFTM